MTPETAPRTAAGRQLLDDIFNLDSGGFPMDPGAAILAIEAEAAAGHTWCEHGIRDDANCSQPHRAEAAAGAALDVERPTTPWRVGDHTQHALTGTWAIYGPEWKVGEAYDKNDADLIVAAVNARLDGEDSKP
jgi:hypothetical protein